MSKHRFLFLTILALLFIYWPLFRLSQLGANDWPTLALSTIKSYFSLPQTWANYGGNGLGYYSLHLLWAWPILWFSGAIANFGANPSLIQHLIYLGPLIPLGIFSCYCLNRQLRLNSAGFAVMVMVFLANTYLLTVIDGGQLPIALAYVLLPSCYIIVIESISKPLRFKLLAAGLVEILAIIEIRFLAILGLLIVSRYIFELGFSRRVSFADFKAAILTALLIAGSLFGFNLYWLLPLLTNPISPQVLHQLTQTSFASFANLGHGLLLITPHWYANSYGFIPELRPEFMIIPLLILLAPILRRRDHNVAYYLLIWLGSIFLIKEANPPLPQFYPWLFSHLPIFNLFRDSSKFFFMTTIAASALIGLTVDYLSRHFHHSKLLSNLIPISIIFVLLTLSAPAWTLQMSGFFSPQFNSRQMAQIDQLFSLSAPFYRILWLPTTPARSNSDINHPILEGVTISQLRPYATSTVGDYELLNYLREAPYINQLLDVDGVAYIAYPGLDLHRPHLSSDEIRYYSKFKDQLTALPWLHQLNPDLPVWQLSQHQDRLFIANQPWWVIGADDIYAESTSSAQLNLSHNGLIFLEEHPTLIHRLLANPIGQIALYHKTQLDLAALLINPTSLIYPAQNLTQTPNQNNWWTPQNSIAWKNFLHQKYFIDDHDFDLGQGFAMAEGTTSATLTDPLLQTHHLLLARVLESSQSGQINFSQNHQSIGQINTLAPTSNMSWHLVGQLIANSPLIIQTSGRINSLNALAVVSTDQWQTIQHQLDTLQPLIKPFTPPNTPTTDANLQFNRLSPTQYQLQISLLTHPTLLVFSESYDQNWQLNGQSTVPVYSHLNGFLITQNGHYSLEYSPQKLINLGLIFSGIFIIGYLALTIFYWTKSHR